MKTQHNILVAFLLNLAFSVFELIGGTLTGSVAIVSDSVHDLGDAVSIGIAYFLEKKSRKSPDENYTYGYARYSVIASMITTVILLIGSGVVIVGSVSRIISPTKINYNGMIIFAVFGVAVNFIAAYFTHSGDSLNQKAVNLHMLEDVLGWAVVLIGAVVMRFTDISLIDPLMSLAVAVFILIHSVGNLKEAIDLFLEKTPHGISVAKLKKHVEAIDGVESVHHIHIWSMDGVNNYATMHVVTAADPHRIKEEVRDELKEHGICHTTLELESPGEACSEESCNTEHLESGGHHHHHH